MVTTSYPSLRCSIWSCCAVTVINYFKESETFDLAFTILLICARVSHHVVQMCFWFSYMLSVHYYCVSSFYNSCVTPSFLIKHKKYINNWHVLFPLQKCVTSAFNSHCLPPPTHSSVCKHQTWALEISQLMMYRKLAQTGESVFINTLNGFYLLLENNNFKM